jgi:hypothetical protein
MEAKDRPVRIGIVGSRRRDSEKDFEVVEKAFLQIVSDLKKQPQEVAIVSGHCHAGGDRFAEILIDKYGTTEGKDNIFPAKWDDVQTQGPNGESPKIKKNRWGKEYNALAGFWRNTDIVNGSDIILACVSPDRTGGTEDTVKKAIASGKTVILVR